MNERSSNPIPVYLNPATLIGVAGLVTIVVLVAMGFSSGSLATAALPALAFLGLALFTHLQFSMAVCAATFFSTLTLPGLPFSLDLSKGFAMAVVARVFLDYIILRRAPPAPGLGGRWIWIYLAVILVTLKVRGFGLRVLGSESWGGGHVIAQLIVLSAFLASNRITLERPVLRWVLRGAVLLSALPMLADLLFFVSRGRIYHQFYLLQFTTGGLVIPLLSDILGVGVWRLQRALIFAPLLTLWVCQAFMARRLRPTLFWLGVGFCVLLIGLSGHRIGMITVLGILTISFILSGPGRMFQRVIGLAVLGVLLGGLTYAAAPHLPRPFQRTLAFLPGLPVDPIVKLDASGTVNSRLQLWRRALQETERYAWVGRGFALSPREMTELQIFNNYKRSRGMSPDIIEEAYLSHDYHNGPITLLIDLGVAGLLAGSLLMFRFIRDAVRDLRRRTWNHPDLRGWYLALTAYLVTNVITFFAVYVSHASMLTLLQIGILLQLTRNADQASDPAPAPVAHEQPLVRSTIL